LGETNQWGQTAFLAKYRRWAETMIPYLARLLDITISNGTIPRDWEKAIVVPIHKEGNRSIVKNYRPVSLTSVVYKQVEHVIAGYMSVGRW
jgi:hypothetical protein